ncbi:ribosome hibernation-promoting factor, HPF/YfiA family [Parvularcula sp. LCG005]|uniref:ribosome hibernation-promoting factor, HPF/YfiA family n=1 Tax=Parvularcula sp. LCG005 TaxID=3078805 RepID=UPI0029429DA5|nr:ribosome-associated translation inhibitor RaiA [Parvularcula sp. LCG005]WOI52896.1 ribosome-associated translation inhibitor RaiA [Parvularcula sp. LCG005]
MDVQITGKAIDLGAALQTYVKDNLAAGVHKYFDRSAEAQVTFDKEGPQIEVEITLHLASGVFLAAQDRAHDAYGAFDGAMTKLEKRVRRYKRRLKDHHANNREELPAETASSYVIAASSEMDEDEAADAPLVIAEKSTILRRMSVSDAVLQLDVIDERVVIFRNAKHGDLNVVYRRDDGNIGWIDGARTAD